MSPIAGPPKAGLRELKKQRTRDAIQAAGLRLFAEHGYEATTCEQIAAAAEVAPATLYRHYPSKEDLVLDDGFDPMLAALAAAPPGGETPLEFFRNLFGTVFLAVPAPDLEAFRVRVRLIGTTRALRGRLYDQLKQAETFFAEAVASRMRADPSELGVRALTAAVLAAVNVAVDAWAEVGGDPTPYFNAALDALGQR
jgi:AcrR family transcriptional regulator